jgi:eukaryotic-like serine/threonine-protein kinase
MVKPVTSSGAVSANDPTVVTNSFYSPGAGDSGSASAVRNPPPAVALVEGSAPKLAQETRSLLQTRLATASLILFIAFIAFLIRHALRVDFSEPIAVTMFGFHVAATIALGAAWAVLRWCHEITFERLRLLELVTFGLPAAFFVAAEYFIVLMSCQEGVLDFPEGGWLVLIYTYALFIPNQFRRAAIVIGVLTATPMVLLFGMWCGIRS